PVESVDRVLTTAHGVVEEVVVNDLVLVEAVFHRPVGHDHVVEPLEGVPRDPRVLGDDVQIISEGPCPGQLPVLLPVDPLLDQLVDTARVDQGLPPIHRLSYPRWRNLNSNYGAGSSYRFQAYERPSCLTSQRL